MLAEIARLAAVSREIPYPPRFFGTMRTIPTYSRLKGGDLGGADIRIGKPCPRAFFAC